MDEIMISVCMPTRNRANFIGKALESIISGSKSNVEIVVVDGASSDNTAEVVQRYKKIFPNLVYFRASENGGVDRDMAKAIELAHGRYCWLFSDDDALMPNAVERMLQEIKSGCEIYLCNVIACNLSLDPIRRRFWLSSKTPDTFFDLHIKDEFIRYCNRANSIGALFSFWSSTVLKREEWLKTGFLHEFDGTAYALAASVFSFLSRRFRLKYIKDPLVYWRNDNISFQDEAGLVRRFLIDFDGYLKLADKYLSDDPQKLKAFLKVMRREHPWYTIIHAASFIDTPEEWAQFERKLLKFGYHKIALKCCYALSRMDGLVLVAVMIKRRLIKSIFLHKLARLGKSL